MTGRGLPILAYHALDDSGSVISTTPAHFSQTMAALDREGFQCVDLLSWVAAGRPPVERGFALTFDDGLTSIRLAAEVISRHSFVATAFLVTGKMGRNNDWPGQWRSVPISNVVSWHELNDLRAAGFAFGAHSVTHRSFSRLDAKEVATELRESKATIENRTGMPCPLLAYPYGHSNKQVRATAASYFEAALGMRLSLATLDEDVYDLSRIDAFYLRSPSVASRLLSGRWNGWLGLRRIARSVRSFSRKLGTGANAESRSLVA